ncbi:MAG: M50 family metallopeptidase [Saprospiraceae bacterium]|nr:M50 family metallopeptidase [Saprospiraceae bacterium]
MYKTIIRVVLILVVYLLLRYFGGYWGQMILYPITRFVTFLHEFGHALAAMITGGKVNSLQINPDGSGLCVTSGGSQLITIMGGYLGSALFGNILFYLGAKHSKLSGLVLKIVSILMGISGIIWFSSFYSSAILIGFALLIYWISNQNLIREEVLMILGLASTIYIIQDFNVGPTSDLQAYSGLLFGISSTVWMYIWLVIVIFMFILNISLIFKRTSKADLLQKSSIK